MLLMRKDAISGSRESGEAGSYPSLAWEEAAGGTGRDRSGAPLGVSSHKPCIPMLMLARVGALGEDKAPPLLHLPPSGLRNPLRCLQHLLPPPHSQGTYYLAGTGGTIADARKSGGRLLQWTR